MSHRPVLPVLTRLTAAFLAGVLAACSSSAPTGPATGRLTLLNATADTLVYGASELEASHRVDLKARGYRVEVTSAALGPAQP